jgi:hypothetical protein
VFLVLASFSAKGNWLDRDFAVKKRERGFVLCRGVDEMIYDVNSALFRSFLSQKGAGEKRKMEEQKPSTQKPKANENKPVMNE